MRAATMSRREARADAMWAAKLHCENLRDAQPAHSPDWHGYNAMAVYAHNRCQAWQALADGDRDALRQYREAARTVPRKLGALT